MAGTTPKIHPNVVRETIRNSQNGAIGRQGTMDQDSYNQDKITNVNVSGWRGFGSFLLTKGRGTATKVIGGFTASP